MVGLPLRCSLFRQSYGVPTTAQQLGIVNSPPPPKKKEETAKKERFLFFQCLFWVDRFFFAFLYQLCFGIFFFGGGVR